MVALWSLHRKKACLAFMVALTHGSLTQGFQKFVQLKKFSWTISASSPSTPSSSLFSVPESPPWSDMTTFQLPRYYPGEVDGGTYPSPLHKIHVVSLLSDEEAAQCLKLAVSYAAATGCWDRPDWDRHSSYATCDFPVEDCEAMDNYLQEIDFHDRLWTLLSTLFGIPPEDMTYLDLFCAHYQAKTDEKIDVMDRLVAHRDGSLLSFTVLLNAPAQFQGGGTFFDGLAGEHDVQKASTADSLRHSGGVIRPRRAGDACLHSGKLLHGADVVTQGNRTVIAGFVEVDERWQRPGLLGRACREWGRMDVALKRWERQQDRTQSPDDLHNGMDSTRKGWFLNNGRWLPKGDDLRGRSHLTGFCPAFPSVGRRADPSFQRIRRLEAEDVLLRTIVASPDAISSRQGGDILGGDITIL